MSFLAASLAALLPFGAPTQPQDEAASAWPAFSYTFLQAEYATVDVDGLSDDPDGYALTGSFAINESFFAIVTYSDTSASVSGFDVDLDATTLGLGYHHPLNERTDLVVMASYVDAQLEADGFGFSGEADDQGFSLSGGLRFWALRQLELAANVRYIDLDESGDDTSFGGNALFYATRNVAVVAGVTIADDSDTFSVGLRLAL